MVPDGARHVSVESMLKFGGFLRLLIPSDMFKRRDADNEIVFPGRHKLDDVLIDDPRATSYLSTTS